MDDWFERFAPGSRASEGVNERLTAITKETFDKVGIKSFADISVEAKMYAPLTALVQAVLDEFGSGPLLEALVKSHVADDIMNDDNGIEIDDCTDSDSENDEDTREDDKDKHDVPSCGIYRVNDQWQDLPEGARHSWHWIETLIWGTTSPSRCPFTSDTHDDNILRDYDEEGREALEELARHASHIFRLQHRTFAYAIYIFRNKARLIYFDRSGAAISGWCCLEEDLHLQRFVYGLAISSDAERGHDTSATLVSPDSQDAKQFRAFADDPRQHKLLQQWVAASIERECPIYKLRVASEFKTAAHEPSSAGLSSGYRTHHEFLVGRPHFSSDALFGRCTRGYIAFDPARNALCFLKDSWRPAVPGRTRPEHEVYERLYSRLRANGRRTDGIPTLLCAGDVRGHDSGDAQESRVHAEFADGRCVLRTHYRLVLREVGVPLEKFVNFKSLVSFMLHAIDTHADAWEYGGIPHRDISMGNILIKVDWEHYRAVGAILCDWDISKYKEELTMRPTELDQAGTWQFKSALSLLFPWKACELADDVESFVHVINYLVLKYYPTTLSGGLLESHVDNFFAHYEVQDGIHFGGDLKWQLLQNTDKAPYMAAGGVGRVAVQELIDSLAALCHQHYRLKRSWVEAEVSGLTTPHPFPSMRLLTKVMLPVPEDSEPSREELYDFIDDFEYDGSPNDDWVPPLLEAATLPLTEPPTLERTLQDHSGLRRVLTAALKNGKWHKGDKAGSQFEGFRGSSAARDSRWLVV